MYGIVEDTKYFKDWDFPTDGVIISFDIAEKYRLKEGDVFVLKEEFGTDLYAFRVAQVADIKSSMNIYMSQEKWCETFEDVIRESSDMEGQLGLIIGDITGNNDTSFYNGYFSDVELDGTYLRDDVVATKITDADLTALSRQMDISMGEMFQMVSVFALVLFALLIFLLTKLVLEKNASSISMTKILGYSDVEIARLYLMPSVWVVIFSSIMALVLNTLFFKVILRIFLKGYGGWFDLVISPGLYLEMFLMMFLTYLVVAVFQFFKIKKIPLDEALKNAE